jgi:hypothetical protein
MTENDEISARLTVLETVVKQLITHMAVRDDDPPLWVQTRKALAMSAIEADAPPHAAQLSAKTEAFFDNAELVVRDYGDSGTPPAVGR